MKPSQVDYFDPNFRLVLNVEKIQEESWMWFLNRSVIYNYEEQPTLAFNLLKAYFKSFNIKDSILFPRTSQGIHVLANFTHINVDRLILSTPHKFALITNSPLKPTLTVKLSNSDEYNLCQLSRKDIVPLRSIKFCPLCIKAGQVHKTEWMLRAIKICSKHKVALQEKCSICGVDISVKSLLSNMCSQCQNYLLPDDLNYAVLSEEVSKMQSLIRSWFIPEAHTQYYDIINVEASIKYLLWKYVYKSLQNPKVYEKFAYSMNFPHEIIQNESMDNLNRESLAAYIFDDWSNNFSLYLDAIFKTGIDEIGYTSISQNMKPIYSLILKLSELNDAEVIMKPIDKYLLHSYGKSYKVQHSAWFNKRQIPKENFLYLSTKEAASKLGVTSVTLIKLSDLGIINKYYGSDKRIRLLFDKAEVSDLADSWARTISLRETSKILGVSAKAGRELLLRQLIVAVRGDTVDQSQEWRIDLASVQKLKVNIWRQVRTVSTTHEIQEIIAAKVSIKNFETQVIDIVYATKLISIVGYSMIDLIESIYNQKITCFLLTESDKLISNLLFTTYSIDVFIIMVKRQNNWVDRAYIARCMNVKVSVVSKWINSGLIVKAVTFVSADYFDKKKVDKFARDHMYSDRVAEILDLHQLTVQKWARKGRLHPVSGPDIDGCHRYLFKRSEVNYWKNNTFYTTPQLAKLLKLSHSQMLQWIHHKVVFPISGSGIDQFQHYLFEHNQEIEDLISKRSDT